MKNNKGTRSFKDDKLPLNPFCHVVLTWWKWVIRVYNVNFTGKKPGSERLSPLLSQINNEVDLHFRSSPYSKPMAFLLQLTQSAGGSITLRGQQACGTPKPQDVHAECVGAGGWGCVPLLSRVDIINYPKCSAFFFFLSKHSALIHSRNLFRIWLKGQSQVTGQKSVCWRAALPLEALGDKALFLVPFSFWRLLALRSLWLYHSLQSSRPASSNGLLCVKYPPPLTYNKDICDYI